MPLQFPTIRARAYTEQLASSGKARNVALISTLEYRGDAVLHLEVLGIQLEISSVRICGELVVDFVRQMPRPPFFAGVRAYFVNPPEVSLSLAMGRI